MRSSIIVRHLVVLFAAWFAMCGLILMLILGSGIYPVPFWVFCMSVSPLAIIWSVAYFRIPRRWRYVSVAAMILATFYLTGSIFMRFVNGGLAHAQAYGEQLAQSVFEYHQSENRWPADLNEIPMEFRPPFSSLDISPYLSYTGEDGYPDKIGGFFISYSLVDGNPQLAVTRKDTKATWDWDSMEWVD